MILTKIDRFIAKIEGYILTTLLLIMILLSAYQVISKIWGPYLKLTPFIWGGAVVSSLVLWVGFVGASIAAHEGGHLAIDFVTHLTPPGFKKYSSLLTSIASAVVCCFFMLAAYKFFQDEKLSESFLIPDLIPSYWSVAIIPFGFMMMMIRFGIKAIESVHSLMWSKE